MHFGKHLEDTDALQNPVFDEHSKGIVFNCVSLPIKQLGLNFCLNRKSSIWYVSDPKYSKQDADKEENYIAKLNEGDYFSMQPRFSNDYSRLCFVASEQKFLTHSGNYQLKSMK